MANNIKSIAKDNCFSNKYIYIYGDEIHTLSPISSSEEIDMNDVYAIDKG